VADDKESALTIQQEALQRFARINVEVVRRLVKQEQVGRHQAKNGELQSTALTAGEHRNLLPNGITAEEELCKVRSCFGNFYRNSGAQRFKHRRTFQPCSADLSQIPRDHTTSKLNVSVKYRKQARDGLQECRFTCTIGTNDANTLPTPKRKAARTSDLDLRRLPIPN
jgi:hypothetical protein